MRPEFSYLSADVWTTELSITILHSYGSRLDLSTPSLALSAKIRHALGLKILSISLAWLGQGRDRLVIHSLV
jgi:hypothetical protein